MIFLVDIDGVKPAHVGEVGVFRSPTRLTTNPDPWLRIGSPRLGRPAYYRGHVGHVVYYYGNKGSLYTPLRSMNDKIYRNWQQTAGDAWFGNQRFGWPREADKGCCERR